DGGYTQIGFDPLYSQGWLYLWGWQNGAQWLSEDGRAALLDDPVLIEALDYLVRLYDDIGGYDTVRGWLNSLGRDPFINQALAMKVDGNWYLNNLAQAIDQDFDWFVAPVPVPADRLAQKGRFAGQPPFITWSGGWSWAIPVGVRNPELAFEAVAFLTRLEGHLANAEGTFADRQSKNQPYIPGMTGHREADRALLERYMHYLPDKFARAQELFIDLLAVTRFRPITPLAPELWKAQAEAAVQAVRHEAPPATVLEDWDRRLQAQLDAYYEHGILSTGE
ncbi:MAG TPA: extracellular solute-binding protein, partial [Limnochordia bacterium]